MPTEQFITTEQLIGRALDRGVELGPNPHQTIEIYIQQGLIPGKLVNGMHPANTVDRLVAIQNLLAQGKNLEEILLLIKQERRNFLSKAVNLTSLVDVYKSSTKGLLMLVSLATLVLFSFTIISKTPGTFAKEALQNGGLLAQEAAKPAGVTLAAILRTAKNDNAASTDPLGLTNINKVITINEKQEVVIEKTVVSSSAPTQSQSQPGNFVTLDENGGINIDGNISIGGVFSGNGSGLTNLTLPPTLLYSDQSYTNPAWLESLDWAKLINRPALVTSVDGVKNDLGDIDLIAGAGVTITPNDTNNTITFTLAGSGVNADLLDSLDSTSFLRNDTSDSFTSGTLTLDAGTTLSVLGSFSCANCVGDAAVSNILTIDATGSVAATAVTGTLTDAQLSNTLTVDSTGSLSATAINSGTLGNAGVTLALASFGSITGSLADANVADTITASSYLPLAGGTMAGNINSNNNLVLNIGNAGTDFTAGGGLNLATDLDVAGHGAFGNNASVSTADILYVNENFTGAGNFYGQGIVSNYTGTDAFTGLWGLSVVSAWSGTGGASAVAVYGLDLEANQFANTAITTLYGVDISTGSQAGTTGAITNAYAANFSGSFFGSDPTTIYGVAIQNFGNAGTTTSYGLYIADQTGSSNNYPIYQAGATGTNYFNASTSTFGRVATGNDTLYAAVIEGSLCVDDTTANCPAGPTAGAIYVENSVGAGNVSAFDISEYYPASEPVEKGDLVIVDAGRVATVMKSNAAYQQSLIGIVATDPALVIDESNITFGKTAGDKFNSLKPYIALAGRVPTKVSGENAAIQPGAPLTSSSTGGVAMKATQNGAIIGRALEAFSGAGQGKILVFVNPSWYSPIETQHVNQLAVNLDVASRFEWENALGQTVAWVNHLGEALFSKVTASLGDFQTLVFGELKVKSGSQISGQAVLSVETNEVFVASDKVQADSLITLTPNSEPNGILYVKAKTAGQGFTVGIKKLDNSNSSTSFTWLIINHN